MKNSSPARSTMLYLVRHGATDANDQRPYVLQGRGINLGLNAAGQRQAAALGEFLARVPVRHVYSSNMRRAVETASAIGVSHGLAVQPRAELAECDVGRWEGMDWDTIMRQHPEAHRRFTDDPAEHPYLEGESYRDVLVRVRPVLRELLERHLGETIVIVAHNIVNRVYLADILDLELRKAKNIRQSNGCVNVIRYQDDLATLQTVNAVFHLEEPWINQAA